MHISDPVVEKDLILVHIDNKPAFLHAWKSLSQTTSHAGGMSNY